MGMSAGRRDDPLVELKMLQHVTRQVPYRDLTTVFQPEQRSGAKCLRHRRGWRDAGFRMNGGTARQVDFAIGSKKRLGLARSRLITDLLLAFDGFVIVVMWLRLY
jgi:hypothetical protein